MEITECGRHAVTSLAFRQELRKILQEAGPEEALVLTSLVLCANSDGLIAVPDELDELTDELREFSRVHAAFIAEIFNSAVEAN